MKQTKTVGSGASSCLRIRTVGRWILCGFIRCVALLPNNPSVLIAPFPNVLQTILVDGTQMLAAIGETFDSTGLDSPESHPESLVTGVIVSSRPQFYRISIWTRKAPAGTDDDALRPRIESIGRHFKVSVLGYSEGQKLAGPLATDVEFVSHKDSEKKGKGGRKIVL